MTNCKLNCFKINDIYCKANTYCTNLHAPVFQRRAIYFPVLFGIVQFDKKINTNQTEHTPYAPFLHRGIESHFTQILLDVANFMTGLPQTPSFSYSMQNILEILAAFVVPTRSQQQLQSSTLL